MLNERPVTFPGPAGLLDGRLAYESNHKGAALVMLHPHPRFGGSMDNNVADAIVQAGQGCGLATLRFNFRGVGRSEGEYADGTGEADDAASAVAFMATRSGAGTIILAGYSFGACVALSYCRRPKHGVTHLFLVAPPPALLEEGVSLEIPEMKKIVLGEKDVLAPPGELQAMLSESARGSLLEVIPGADHFFGGKDRELRQVFERLLSEVTVRPQ